MKTIKIIENDDIFRIILNRPKVHNAFHPEMISELTDTFKSLQAQKDIKAIVLSGEGSSFCSGADLNWMKSMSKFSFEENIKDAEKLHDLLSVAQQTLTPIVGKIHGHVFGGGLGLLAICDIVAVEKQTQFCFSEVKLGLVPAIILPFVLLKASSSQVREYALTAKTFGTAEAKDMGLIQFYGDVKSMDEYIDRSIDMLRRAGTAAVRETKRILNMEAENYIHKTSKSETIRIISERRVSEEGQEGLSAFFEKREPRWSKK